MALAASGLGHATVLHKPRLLSDNVLCWEAAAAKGQQVSLRRL
jgi:putative transposase